MTHRVVLGLDQGSGSSRALLVDPRGRILGMGAAPAPRKIHPSGWIDQDPERCWKSLRQAVRHAMDSSDVETHEISAIGLACQRSTSVLFERETLKPLLPAISWQCRRNEAFLKSMSAARRRAMQQRTGLPVSPHYFASKARWLLDHLPAGSAEHALGTLDSWLIARLLEVPLPLTDLSQASRTLLVDLGDTTWSPRNLEAFGLDEDLLPQVLPTVGLFGHLRRGALPPLREGIPLLASVGDQQAALFAAGLRNTGQAKITYGSGAFLLCDAGPTVPPPQESGIIRSVAFAEDADTHYMLEANLPSAGTVIEWWSHLTGKDFGNLLARDARRGPSDLEERLGGLTFVPTFSGMGPPHADIPPGGHIRGLTLDSDAPRIATALSAGIAAAMADGVHAVEQALHRKLSSLTVDGGGSRDRVFLQIQADVLQKKLWVSRHPEATAFGAAALAHHALSGVAPALKQSRPIEPQLALKSSRRLRKQYLNTLQA